MGLETNFVAADATETVGGMLLGRPASVRFTPVGYRWDYGDGSTRTSSGPGASWVALGVREFDPTGTSHRYPDRGTYPVTLTVEYSAAYSWDGSAFTPIEGTLTAPAGTAPVRILVESTVLVGADCAANPAGPGC
ncbi:MAG: PKD domain-containing protein [Micrococcales bacterium]|nr:PKD domain-containing protein [Micrococcales bacterium]